MKGKSKIFLATIMSLMMVLGTASSVFAVDELPAADVTGGTAITINKHLKFSEGVSVPAAEFTFTATGENTAAKAQDTANNKLTIGTTSAKYEVGDGRGTATNGVYSVGRTATLSFAKGVPQATGEYTYIVTEDQSGITDLRGQVTTKTHYDTTAYRVRVYVKQSSDTTKGTNGYYISNVTVAPVTDGGDNGTYTDADDTEGNKVKELGFTNIYQVKNEGGTNPVDPDKPSTFGNSALVIAKDTTGEFADTNDAFEFTLTMIKDGIVDSIDKDIDGYAVYTPATATDAAYMTYTGYITDGTDYYTASKDGTSGEIAFTKVDDKAAAAFTITSNDADANTSFYLKDGMALVFDKLPTGTRYVATEVAADDKYTPGYTLTEDGEIHTAVEANSQADSVTALYGTEESALVGDAQNSVLFTNDAKDTNNTLTGVIINNLPFIILGAVVLAALGLLVASRRRFSREA